MYARDTLEQAYPGKYPWRDLCKIYIYIYIYIYYFKADNLYGTDRIASQLIIFPDNFYSLSD